MKGWRIGVLWMLFALPCLALAEDKACPQQDFSSNIAAQENCLVMRAYGAGQPEVMVVWLHGDVSSGGPANYHFPLAQRFADEYQGVLSVALVRPGYADGEGLSSGRELSRDERRDHYTRQNVAEVAAGIEGLKRHYAPKRVYMAGHSGGAAMTAILLAQHPGLVDGAVLVACPCDLVAWRGNRRAWSASENPIRLAGQVPSDVQVVALTGGRDENTAPQLARRYIEVLQQNGVAARFQLLEGEGHNSAFRSPATSGALRELIEAGR